MHKHGLVVSAASYRSSFFSLFPPEEDNFLISYPPKQNRSLRFKYPGAICIKREINIRYNKETLEKSREPSGNDLHYKMFHSYLIHHANKMGRSVL